MRSIILALVVLCFCPYLAHSKSVEIFPGNCSQPAPEISGREIVQVSRVEFRISDESAAYLGLMTDYRNPLNGREFVKVISRHNPLISEKRIPTNERSAFETA